MFSDIHYGHKMIRSTTRIGRDLEVLLLQREHHDCKEDHGERTNRKLKDQPFHQRGRNGKMKPY